MAQDIPAGRKSRAHPLNNNRLHSMLLLYLSSQVLCPRFAGHVVDSDIRALLRELDTNQFAQASAACALLVKCAKLQCGSAV